MVKFHWDLGKWDLWCMGHFSENSRSLQNVCLKIWRHNIVTGWRDNIRSCFRAIECGVSTGFIWVCTQTLRWHQCTRLGDAFHPWVWNSFINSFSKIWTVQLLITSDYILLILAKTVLLLSPNGWYNTEKNQQWFFISFVTTRYEIPSTISTVKSARTLRFCCLFSNSMEYEGMLISP